MTTPRRASSPAKSTLRPNAWLAHAGDFSEETPTSLAENARKLAAMLSRGGFFFLSPLNLLKVAGLWQQHGRLLPSA